MILHSKNGEMRLEISKELKNKIKRYMTGYACITKGVPPSFLYLVKFEDDEFKLFKECFDWLEFIDTYFSTSYEKRLVKVNVGRFEGVFPKRIWPGEALFNVDCEQPPSWKDWFIQEE